VGADDNRDPLFLVETTEEGVESLPRLLIEVSAGLVAQESPGGLNQGPGDGHPLLLARGHGARPVLGPMGEAQVVEQRFRPLARFGQGTPRDQHRHHHVLEGGGVGNWTTSPRVRFRNSRRWSSSSENTSWPATTTRPLSGRSRLPRTCRRVDFPTPDAPTIATISRGATVRCTPARTGT